MVDPRVIHTVTVELCTGAALFTALCILMKLTSDGYLRYLGGKWETIDRLAVAVTKLAEPSSYLLGIGAVFFTFISMYTGMNAWPLKALLDSGTVHNKIMLVSFSQTMFIIFISLRYNYGLALWENRKLIAVYSLLAVLGGGIVALQNSVAGHLAGKGSLFDPILALIGVDLTKEVVLPPLISLAIIAVSVGSLVITAIFWWKAQTEKQQEEVISQRDEPGLGEGSEPGTRASERIPE